MAEVALVYHGNIGVPATTRLRNALCSAALGGLAQLNNVRPTKLYLLISSMGGSLEDGISLYNLLRALQIPLVTVNMSAIASIANVVFLAGDTRIACPDSHFHFHNYEWNFSTPMAMDPDRLLDTTQQLASFASITKSIFKARTQMTDADFDALKFLDKPVVKDATFAQQKGIVQQVALPALPAGTPILNVDY